MFGGVIGEWLIGVTLVNSDGEVKSYDESDMEALSALRCCVGMCGVFYELVFKVFLMLPYSAFYILCNFTLQNL